MSERIEIYKIVVDTITASEARRQQAGSAYIGMIAAIVTATGAFSSLTAITAAVQVFVIALVWSATVCYFRRLATAKFDVIAEMEKDLEIAAFDMEWKRFKEGKKAFSLTRIEMIIPVGLLIISGVYVVLWIACYIWQRLI
ncbi:MAG: hypothetical protein GDA49_13490 [Rhodospirillales bacterium]|nr:hypothetical protein [Rhodospirillales bacterium]